MNQNINMYSHSHQVLEVIFGTSGSGTPFDTANNIDILRRKLLLSTELIYIYIYAEYCISYQLNAITVISAIPVI
jgi:hypothetical protein